MAPFIIGGILIALGVFCGIYFPMRIKNKNIEIQFAQTTVISELIAILTENAKAGLEGYRHYVELKGQAVRDTLQKAPFSGKEVAYYGADLHQVFEETVTINNSTGRHQQLKKSESVITSQKSTGPIALKDAQSEEKVYIDIAQPGLQLDTLKTLDKFEPANNMQNYSFFSNLRYNPMGTRTLGFRMIENTIPLGQSLYVLGEAYLDGARVNIGKPRDSKKPFIVSVKNEAEIVQGNKTGAKVTLVLGILLALAGILVMIFMH
jgi:hypothetical protein